VTGIILKEKSDLVLRKMRKIHPQETDFKEEMEKKSSLGIIYIPKSC